MMYRKLDMLLYYVVVLLAMKSWSGHGAQLWQKISSPPIPAIPSLPKPTPTTQPRICGKVQAPSGRVISGTNSTHGSWPWQVSIYYMAYLVCGGVLISPTHVLTAAHCLKGMSPFYIQSLRIVLGDHTLASIENSEQIFTIAKFESHQRYMFPTSYNNDILVITLNKPAFFNTFVQPSCLPRYQETLIVKRTCFITGWGRSQFGSFDMTDTLQQSPLKILSQSECQQRNNKVAPITSQMFCAAMKTNSSQVLPNSACHGDSGGPLVCKDDDASWTLYGIVSWGSWQCNSTDAFTVFTKVPEFVNWINHNMLPPLKTVVG